MKPSNNLENKTPSDTYWRVQLVCKKVQAHSFLEPPLEYNQDQLPLTNKGSLWPYKKYKWSIKAEKKNKRYFVYTSIILLYTSWLLLKWSIYTWWSLLLSLKIPFGFWKSISNIILNWNVKTNFEKSISCILLSFKTNIAILKV